MNLNTISFEEVLKFYMGSIKDSGFSEEQLRAAEFAFVAGMKAGCGVQQNRLARLVLEIRMKGEEEKKRIFPAMADVCAKVMVDLEKLNMDVLGIPYGTG